MSFLPISSSGNYTPEDLSIPRTIEELAPFLKSTLEEHSRLINRKDTGQYENVEIQNNQTFYGATPQSKRYIYRKVINTGTLPNAALATIAHGIAGVAAQFFFTRIYGTAWDPAGLVGISLPNPGPTYPLEAWVDSTNVYLRSTVNLNAFTISNIVLEYFKG